MPAMNISLTEQMREFVEAQLQEGGYSTASEYVRALIRAEQKRKAQERLEALLMEGLESGPGKLVTREYFEDLKRDIAARHGGKGSSAS